MRQRKNLSIKDLTLTFTKYRKEKFDKKLFFIRMNIFKQLVNKYGEDFVEFLLKWAMENEPNFYSPKYLFCIAEKVKPYYKQHIEQITNKPNFMNTDFKKSDKNNTTFSSQKNSIELFKVDLSIFD